MNFAPVPNSNRAMNLLALASQSRMSMDTFAVTTVECILPDGYLSYFI